MNRHVKPALLAVVFLGCLPRATFAQRGGGINGNGNGNGPNQQQNIQPQATGTVTGHVYCRDTQRPARFADVELLRQSTSQDPSRPNYQPVGRARTALDGSFTITNVAAGDYFVAAQLAGYVSVSAMARMTGNPISGAPSTHVDVNRSADVQVSLERGAVVSGRVTYDDGTPIPGTSVRLRPADSGTTNGGQRGGFGGGFGGDLGFDQTDDRGVFRASGLPPGRYVVTTAVQTETTGRAAGGGRGGFGGFPSVLNVYAPATMHKTDARVIEIRGGETVEGVDIQVALTGLHVLQGSVVAKADSHPLNSGMVMLSDTADSSFSRNAAVEPDGTFRVEYLPSGSYTLRVQGQDRSPRTPGRPPSNDSAKRYQNGTATATVTNHDVTVDPVQLEEAKPAPPAATAAPAAR